MAVNPPTQMPGSTAFSLTPLGKYAGKPPIVLSKAVVMVGTDERCHLRIVSSSVSRHHALIVHGDDGIYIRDLASRTKVLVNGQEQREADLADGDEIQVGKYSFKFSSSEEPIGLSLPAAKAQILVNGQPIPDANKGRVLLIGRTPDCDIPIADERVSSRHAVIFEANGKRFLRDLDSRTGTFRNGKKIHQSEIRPGDLLRIGKATLTLAILAELPEAAEKPIGFEPSPVEVEPPPSSEIPESDFAAEPVPVEIQPEIEPASESAPLELEPEPEPAADAPEIPAASSEPEIDLSDINVLRDLELEPSPKIEAAEPPLASVEIEPEPVAEIEPAEPVVPETNLSDEDVLRELELKVEPKIEAVEPPPLAVQIEPEPIAEAEAPEPAAALPETSFSDEDVLRELELKAEPKIEAVETPPLPIQIEPEPIAEVEAPEPAAALPETSLSDEDVLRELELKVEPKIEAVETPPLPIQIEPEPIAEVEAPEPTSEPTIEAIEPPAIPVEIESPAPLPIPEIAISDQDVLGEPDSEPASPIESNDLLIPPPLPEIDFSAELASLEMDLQPEPNIEAIEPLIPPPLPQVDVSAQVAPPDSPPEHEPEIQAIQPMIAPPPPQIDFAAEPAPTAPEPVAEIQAIEPLTPPPLPDIDFAAEAINPETQPEPEPKIEAPTIEAIDDLVPPPLPEINFTAEAASSEPEPQPEPASEPIESLIPPPLPEIDFTAEPAPAEPEHKPEPTAAAIEPLIPPPLSEKDFAAKVTPIETTEPSPVAEDQPRSDDSTSAPDIDLNPPEISGDLAPIAFESAPIDLAAPPASLVQATTDAASVQPPQESAPAEDSALDVGPIPVTDDLTDPSEKKSRRGHPRRLAGEPPPPKTPRKRSKRIPPRASDESTSEPIQPSTPPDIESGLEIRADDFSPSTAEIPPAPPADEHTVTTVPPPSQGFSTFVPDEDQPPAVEPVAPAPVESESAPLEPVPFQNSPAPAPQPPEPEAPLSALGGMEFFGGGTVNLDHFLGGMPIQLQELTPTPPGFGKIRYDLEPKSPPPPPARSFFQPPETVVPTPLSTKVSSPPPPPPPKSDPRLGRKPPTFATDHEISADEFPPTPRPTAAPRNRRPVGGDASEKSSAFEGLAMPTVRQTDVFSDRDPIPVNDAPFGGASLGQTDDFILPDSPERAARLANTPEQDFADDDFWNRTDEEDGLAPKNATPQSVTPKIVTPKNTEPIAVPPPPPIAPPIEPTVPPIENDAPDIAPEPSEPILPPEPEPEPLEAAMEITPAEDAALDLNAPIPAEPVESPEPVEFSPPLDEPEDSSTARQAPIDIAAPPPRKRRRFRIPFLMPLMLLAVAGALVAIWRFIPVQSQIVGKVTYLNFNWTPGTQDANEFEASQRRLLDSDKTHADAVETLRRAHPEVSPGFLQIPEQLSRAVSSLSINAAHEIGLQQAELQLSYTGGDKTGDSLRMLALLRSLVDSNAPLLDDNRRLIHDEQKAKSVVEEARQKYEDLKNQLVNLQLAMDDPQSGGDLKQLTDRKSQLQKNRADAADAVNADQTRLAALQSPAASDANPDSATTQPADAVDPQLAVMRQQLADLTAEMQSARSDQVAGAILARQQLEAAAKDFNDQLTSANSVLGSGSQLRQFVDSAKYSQAKAHDLINMLIVDGEDLEKQLEDTRRAIEDLIQARQDQKWADDPQLQQLRANLDSAQHRYNANVGDGIRDPRVLDPLQKEIDDWTTQVKARQAQLGIDPGEIKVQQGLANLIQSLRNKLDKQKLEIDQVLNPLEKQLNDLDPVIAALPEAQQDLAHQIHLKLDALNAARWKYSLAIGQGQLAPSPKVTELQKQIDDLKTRLDSRQSDLNRELNKSHQAQRARDLKATQSKLDADQKTLEADRKAFDDILPAVEAAQTHHDAAQAAAIKKIDLQNDQQTAFATLEAAKNEHDQKQALASRAFDIKPVADSDVVATSPADPRMLYSVLVMGAAMVVFTILTFITHAAARDSTVPEHEDPNMPPADVDQPQEALPDDDEEPLPA